MQTTVHKNTNLVKSNVKPFVDPSPVIQKKNASAKQMMSMKQKPTV